MHAIDLFSIGNALVDQEFSISDDFLQQHALQKGTMQLGDAAAQSRLYENLTASQNFRCQAAGGSAANSVVAFAAMGGQAFYACRVGDDVFGQQYLQGLNEAKVLCSNQSISQGTTGSCLVMISPDSERTMHTYLGTSAELSAEQIDFNALQSAQWMYIEGYLSSSPAARIAVVAARKIAREHQVKIALSLSDPAMVQYAREGLDELLGDGVDLIFCNAQEALMYTQSADLEQAMQKLLHLAQQVVITLGADGAMVADHKQQFKVAGRPVHAVDTTGAGDAFSGAMLYALQQRMSLQRATAFAVLVSSEVVAQFGPRLTLQQYRHLLQQFQQEKAQA
ncbi:adenosine kinase [Acinetobacter larvae]|uniref:Adenosine kinase n=1 Tax=Acinetobacter larvae TaxID=1789224 RepID=A0A1B2M0P1_9GAMM|nr:adenosine kinase [Acinetobacter larvae]AOA58739.1 adenosine kinase [Acinetobacter larvae]